MTSRLAWPNSPRIRMNPRKIIRCGAMCARRARSSGKFWAQSGQDLFESVEELRRLLIEHRETVRRSPEQASSPVLMLKAQEIVSRMDLSRAYQVTKAFATYFELTNLAETNHRKRRRRAGKLD